ncbi:MAG TPA: response regulator transcription factor [Blastocatellia bacterium]|nr:response regulator transcription factor [Blastocatellia bacterium]
MEPIQVLIAENLTIVRAGIRALLDRNSDVRVVGEASDGREAIQLVEKLQPDVVLMSIALPAINGMEAMARIAREFPKVRVVIVSSHTGEDYVWEALRSGARGYVSKAAAPQELELAIRAVVGGKTYVSPSIVERLTNYEQVLHGERSLLHKLTPRQREVLQLIAEGRSTKAIADQLSISVKTVETHRSQLMDRLGIHDVAGLVRYAIRAGLINIELTNPRPS